jgi:phage repressor protein C with HTH and peptisase S24 domain
MRNAFCEAAFMGGELAERLQLARAEAGFERPTQAARAYGWVVSTYLGYENGDREPSKETARRIAEAYRVSLDWLLSGRGAMRGRRQSIPVAGSVGAGAVVEIAEEPPSIAAQDTLTLPGDGEIAGLLVRGDSQWPRFLDGEFILFDPRPANPADLVGQYAIVQTLDGRRMIKTLQRSPGGDLWRLESHNARPEDDVELLGAWRYLGVLPASAADRRPGVMKRLASRLPLSKPRRKPRG